MQNGDASVLRLTEPRSCKAAGSEADLVAIVSVKNLAGRPATAGHGNAGLRAHKKPWNKPGANASYARTRKRLGTRQPEEQNLKNAENQLVMNMKANSLKRLTI